jgi:hypothetical protein
VCTKQYLVPSLVHSVNWPLLGKTLRAPRQKFTRLSGVLAERPANDRTRDQRATRGLRQRSSGRTGLSGVPWGRWLQRSASPNKEGIRTLLTVRCAPDSPVHPRTEGNHGLPNGAPTAPRSLEAIKGTPWRMELHTKHSLNIL